MMSSSKSFGAAFFFGGFALLLAGVQLWFGHATEAVTAALSHRVFEASLMLVGTAVATAGVRSFALAQKAGE